MEANGDLGRTCLIIMFFFLPALSTHFVASTHFLCVAKFLALETALRIGIVRTDFKTFIANYDV